jgi:predicted Zn-dependent protease
MKTFLLRVESIYLRPNSAKVDAAFIQSDWAQRSFSKWRSGSAGVYAWRASKATDVAERVRMKAAAEAGLRQAFALCPSSAEVVFRLANLVMSENRVADAAAICQTSLKVKPGQKPVEELLAQFTRPAK